MSPLRSLTGPGSTCSSTGLRRWDHDRALLDPLSVLRDELEGASCIRYDNTFTLRCTVSFPKPADGKIMRWYRRVTGSKPEDVVVLSESRTIVIENFSWGVLCPIHTLDTGK